MTNLTHFSQCIYFTPLHVPSNKCSSSGGSNCVNTSSGIIHSSGWLSCVPTGTQDKSPTRVYYTRWCIDNLILLMMSTCCSEHVEAWNKYIEKSASSWSLTRVCSTVRMACRALLDTANFVEFEPRSSPTVHALVTRGIQAACYDILEHC